MEIKIKKLNDYAVMPFFASASAAGCDLYAATDYKIQIKPHETVMIGTGIAMEIPEGYFGGIYPRSGLASKKGLRPANCIGVVDSDYRGEVIVALHNDTDEIKIVEARERIAQLIIQNVIRPDYVEADVLSETVRGTGGFGSTGSK